MHNIDERSLHMTAGVLKVVNPGRSSKEHIKDMIRANMDPDKPGSYIATAGWVAYSWATREGKVWISVAVEPYSVAMFNNIDLGDVPSASY